MTDNESAKKCWEIMRCGSWRRVLVRQVKANASIDWTIKESVQAKLRVIVKRTLRRYGYPPDKAISATDDILRQAKLFANEWNVLV